MRGAPEEFARNEVSFVVYNYDRCIEHFFCRALAAQYNLSQDVAFEASSKLKVVHPHGLLAPYVPEFDSDRGSEPVGRRFDSTFGYPNVKLAADHIRLFWEQSPEQEGVRFQMSELFARAEVVVFLGFGFLDSNMRDLLPHLRIRGAGRHTIYATTFGLPSQDAEYVKLNIFQQFARCAEVDCLGLLQEHIPLRHLQA